MDNSESDRNEEKENTLLKEFTEERNIKYPKLQLTFRKLQYEDFDKGFFETLSWLTVIGDVSKEGFIERFRKLGLADSNTYKIISKVLFTLNLIKTLLKLY